MQPFEETCKGKLSQLALNVLADAKGVVWLYGELVMLLEYLSRVRLVYGDNLLVILEFV